MTELADDAKHWLDRLHEAYDLCREFFQALALQSDGPGGELLTWGEKPPLPFYHTHQPVGEVQACFPTVLAQQAQEFSTVSLS